MTKAEEKRQQVEANKRMAWFKKVRVLTGHIFKRLDAEHANAAYEFGKTADEYAAELAAREPVGKALHPAKERAVAYATERAREVIERVRKELEEAGWDVNKAAPYPSSSQPDYQAKRARYQLFSRLVKADPSKQATYRMNDPRYVVISDDGIAQFIEHAQREAAGQYDAFIVKMVGKVGECLGAEIVGDHIWAHSVLTVTKETGVERWKTQQITNYSVYGTPYLQWPSRLMK